MAYSPILSGSIVVEVPKDEYSKLMGNAEKIAAVERYIANSEYPSIKDIQAILGIARKENEE